MDRFRIGVTYFNAGYKVQVEKGYHCIGHTSQDPLTGEQVFFWPSEATFVKDGGKVIGNRVVWPKEIFEVFGNMGVRAVPTLELLEPVKPATQTGSGAGISSEAAPAWFPPVALPVFPPPPPPPPMPEAMAVPQTLKDDVCAALGGRKLRTKDFAVELGMSHEKLLEIVNGDERYLPIQGGWLRRSTQPEMATP